MQARSNIESHYEDVECPILLANAPFKYLSGLIAVELINNTDMTIINMLIMMFTLLLLFVSQGSLALVPEGMWHNNNNNNNNNNIASYICMHG